MKIQPGYPLPLGVTMTERKKCVQISVWAKDKKECRLILEKAGKKVRTIKMSSMKDKGTEDIFSVCLTAEHHSIIDELKDIEYYFEAEGDVFLDPYARQICGRDSFGHHLSLIHISEPTRP